MNFFWLPISLAEVLLLTENEFHTFVESNPLSLINFMAPWCQHCISFQPEFEKASGELATLRVKAAEVDATVDRVLARRYGIDAYPTVYFFINGTTEAYSGGRSAASIVKWVKQMIKPAVEIIQEVAASALGPVTFVASLNSTESPNAKLFELVASENKPNFMFAMILDRENAENVSVYLEGVKAVSEELSEDANKLRDFIKYESVPVFGPVDANNYEIYLQRAGNWVWLASARDIYNDVRGELEKFGREYRRELNLVWLDTDVFKQHAQHILGMDESPFIAVVYEEEVFHYNDEVETVSAKKLAQFVEKVKSGRITRFLRSEIAADVEDNSLIQEVIGSNFSELVLNKHKDVLLLIYAPWCRHCTAVATEFLKVAEYNTNNPHLILAKFDGSENKPDILGINYTRFPTIYYFRGGETNPIEYSGDRSAKSLMQFARKHSTQQFNFILNEKDEL